MTVLRNTPREFLQLWIKWSTSDRRTSRRERVTPTRGGQNDPWKRVCQNDLCHTERRVEKLQLKVKLQFHRGMEISSGTRWDI